MSDTVISVENVSKKYRLGEARHDTLRDRIMHTLRRPFRRNGAAANEGEFWALRDVSFEVKRGEVLGIIGRNGAGKSTLLKILSRITEPTTGRISLRGRVASLLEVGTGFHPELSGRENIFLNGAILGMSRQEIRGKFDEIVAFAEVERFLDTPVKHYSSGMYVRLAFAVAAHLEPEILIVDEVLAVGDTQFQQKCLGRMEEVARGEGRTVLFVSHNLAAVRQLCHRGILLANGSLVDVGPTGDVLGKYQSRFPVQASVARRSRPDSPACFTLAALRNDANEPSERFRSGDPICIFLSVAVGTRVQQVQVAIRVSTLEGIPVLTTSSADAARRLATLEPGQHEFTLALPSWLAAGRYALRIALCEPQRRVYDSIDDELQFEISEENSIAAALHDERKGVTTPLVCWEHKTM